MTDTGENREEPAADYPAAAGDVPQGPPIWLRATLADLVALDFEAPIEGSQSADSNELSERFRTAAESAGAGGNSETPVTRVYSMLAAVTGMHLRSGERRVG